MGSSRLFWRLFLICLITMSAFLAVTGFVLESRVDGQVREHAAQDLEFRARLCQSLLAQGRSRPAQELARELGRVSNSRVTLIRRDGVVFGDSAADPAALSNHADRPEVIAAIATGVGVDVHVSRSTGVHSLYVAVTDTGDTAAPVVRCALPMEMLRDRARDMTSLLRAALAALLLLACGASWLVAALITRPIERLRDAAQRIARGDERVEIEASGRDDLAELSRSVSDMNAQMLKRVAELEGRQRELASIMENISEGILLIDAQGQVALVNRAATRLLAQPASSLEGKPLWQTLRHPEVNELIQGLSQSEEPARARIEIDDDSGAEPRDLELIATPLFEIALGQQRAVLLVIDKTEDRRLDRMRRDFLADVSHELKTPLTSIKAYVETLLDGALDDEATRRPFLEKIHANTERLAKLVSDILDISRLENAPRDDARTRRDMGALAERVTGQFRERAAKKAVDLRYEPGPGPGFALVNEEDLTEAVENLIDNAINYTPENGQVRVSVGRRESEIVVQVADTGCGIPAESLPRVFERFYRVDKARSRALGGTGLGLSIVKHVALRHGGRVEAESEVGKGSVFRIVLPAA